MDESIQINMSDDDLSRSRELVFGVALDTKRPTAWSQYGYPDDITFDNLMRAYERGGPGHGAVHRLLGKCWQKKPRIKRPEADEEGDWEKVVAKLFKDVLVWKKLRDFDRKNMVGRYAAMIYRVGDGSALKEPLKRATKLVDLIPVFENQIKVTKWQDDQNAEDYGQPLMYQIRTRAPAANIDVQAQPEAWLDIHPSRVQVLAEGSVGDMFAGTPLLKAGYNSLVDLEKIAGGSAESFLKNSARTVVFEYDPAASVQAIGQNADGTPTSVREAHESQTRKLNRNQDSSIVMQGGKANTLQTTISDPTGAWTLAANLFAASVQIPFTILFGQQTGRLASDEDKADMLERCVSRQANELTPMIEQFVRRMQECGVIEGGEFEVEWPPLDAPGDDEKYDQVAKLAAAMKQAFDAGLTEPLFDANELRGVAGFEPREDDGMPSEEEQQAEVDAEREHQLALKTAAGAQKLPPAAARV